MDPNKIQAIQNFQPPLSKKQVQSFLGFIHFNRKYIHNFSQLTSVLSQKQVSIGWAKSQYAVVDKMK